MKISYVLQLKDFTIMFAFGVLLGIFFGIINIINYIKPRFFTQIIADVAFSIISILLFVILINKINMGQIRLFLCTGYILGFWIERITLGKLFAKGYKNVYNNIIKVLKAFAKSKIGRTIFK